MCFYAIELKNYSYICARNLKLKIMKELIIEASKLLIGFCAIFCMGMSIIFPLMIGMKDCPYWMAFIIYPVTLFTIAYMNLQMKKDDEKSNHNI